MTSQRHRTTEWTIISELTWCLILFLFLPLQMSLKGLSVSLNSLNIYSIITSARNDLWVCQRSGVLSPLFYLFSFFRSIVYFPVFFLAWAEVRSESVISRRERVIRWTIRLDQSDWVLLSSPRSSNNFKVKQSFSHDIDWREQKRREREKEEKVRKRVQFNPELVREGEKDDNTSH